LLLENGLAALLADLDTATTDAIDINNPRRVQRAWEVLQATGRSIVEWHAMTPPPLLTRGSFEAIVLEADVDWLNQRIDKRFDMMIEAGALDEARDNLDIWDPSLPSHQAIGAPELIAYLRGELELNEARDLATIATHQFAKRQRTWFRKRMRDWTKYNPALR
jgi:tRNA dimethylallyltransferase